MGSATLVDKHTGKELNLDGSLKHPYRHPHFAGKQQPPYARSQPAANPPQQVLQLDPEQRDANLDRRLGTPQDNRRPLTLVKPAKYNIPEFDGVGTDSWIQTIEMYFEAARTPIEQKIGIAVTYLKGPAIEWWRGTGMVANTIPWYRFCRFVGDRFSETSEIGRAHV